MNNQVLIDRLRKEFPLWDLRGANEAEHHCELAMFHDRKRLHALLDSALLQSPAPEGVELIVLATKSHGAWDGLETLNDLPDGSELMTIAQHRAIVAGLAGDGWIACSDRLPEREIGEEMRSYWCWGTYEDQYAPCGFEGIFLGGKWYCLNIWGEDRDAVVTHWQLLPPSPKEGGL